MMDGQKEKRALALFDFDGTLIPGDSIAAYVRYARKKGFMPFKAYMKALLAAAAYSLGRMSAKDSKNAALCFRMGLKEKERRALDEGFVRDWALGKIYPAGKACVDEHRRAGRVTLLISASTDNYMLSVGDALGFDAVLCSPLAPDGTVSGNCKGEEKVRRLNAWLRENGLEADFPGSFAYGDSKSDLPMLRLCGHPVQVNPKRALRRAAPGMETVYWHTKGGKTP